MAITLADFNKIWASSSPLTPYSFSESQYKEGWNFIGGTPPSRQMWDFLQKNNDEKSQYLLNNFDNYLPLSGGTVSGNLTVEGTITGNLAGNADTATNATNATNDANGNPIASTYLPAVVGAVVAFAGSTTPQGWLLCDGSAVDRTDYAALYAVIGTTYGAGNGSTTFNLPNLTDKFIQGSATAGTVKSAGLPNITGRISTGGGYGFDGIFNADNRGAFNTNTESQNGWSAATEQKPVDDKSYQALFDASLSNPIYGNSTTVQPPALTMRYIIKY